MYDPRKNTLEIRNIRTIGLFSQGFSSVLLIFNWRIVFAQDEEKSICAFASWCKWLKDTRDVGICRLANPRTGANSIRIRICIILDLQIDANPGFVRFGNPSNSGFAGFANKSSAMRTWVYMVESRFALDSRVLGSQDLQGFAARTNRFSEMLIYFNYEKNQNIILRISSYHTVFQNIFHTFVKLLKLPRIFYFTACLTDLRISTMLFHCHKISFLSFKTELWLVVADET